MEIEKVNPLNLTKEEIFKAKELAKKIDYNNDSSIINFGIDTQRKLGESSNKILEHVKTKDVDEVGEILTSLVQKIQAYDVNQNWFEKTFSKLPVLNKVFNHTKKIISQYKTVETNLSEITIKLEKNRSSLNKDNINLKIQYEDNIKYIKENKINIEALKIVVEDLKNVIKEKELDLSVSNNEMISQEINVLTNKLNRLDKKIHNLKIFETSIQQSLPRLLMIQEGNNELMENIQFSILNVIPLWKNQVAEAISLNKQKSIADIQESVYSMTNDLIKSNSTKTKENMILIAKQMEKDVIDIETIEKSNRDIIETIDAVLKIKSEGREKRIDVQKRLETIKTELSDKINSLNKIEETTINTDYEEI